MCEGCSDLLYQSYQCAYFSPNYKCSYYLVSDSKGVNVSCRSNLRLMLPNSEHDSEHDSEHASGCPDEPKKVNCKD